MTSPRFKEYARYWGFEYHEITQYEAIDHEPQGYWIKFHYANKLLKSLKDGDLISFLDADISIVRGDVALTTKKSVGLTFDSAGVLNAGLFAVRVNDFSRWFFEKVYNRRDTDDHPLIDNMAVLKTLEELSPNQKEAHIEVLPNYLNVTRIENELPSFNRNLTNPTILPVRFRHFAGGQPWLQKYFDKPIDFSINDDFQYKFQPYRQLPIHFFTVLNRSTPFIRYHIELLKQLTFRWHWHIVDGVSGFERIREKDKEPIFTILPRTNAFDDAAKYISYLKSVYPGRVTAYGKEDTERWNNVLEMLNAPLKNIKETAILFYLDPDELWTFHQLFRVRNMFADNPTKQAAYFRGIVFAGEDLVVMDKDFEWANVMDVNVRAWRFEPGMCWMDDISPVLARELADGRWVDISSMDSFSVIDTDARKLNYQHYAFVTEEQVLSKLKQSGGDHVLDQWRILQAKKLMPVRLNMFFPWVDPNIRVTSAHSLRIRPILKKKGGGIWSIVNPIPWLKEDWSHPINCPHCRKEIIVSVRGTFNCPHCNGLYAW